MYPKLKFKISASEDVKTFLAFVAEAEYTHGRDLRWAVVDKYPFFKKFWKEDTLSIGKKDATMFVRDKYQEDKDVMESGVADAEKRWAEVSNSYFKLTDELFGDLAWPSGEYIVYPTIWGMFSRNVNNKIFQIPYKDDSMSPVEIIIAHEMLHFIFYEYLFKLRPELRGDEYEMTAWHISEIFNVVIQNSKKWIDTFGKGTPEYPEHETVNKKLLKKYPEITDDIIQELVGDIVDLVKGL